MRSLVPLIALLAAGLPAAQAAPLAVVGFNVQSDNSSDLFIGHQLARSSGIDLWGLTEIYREGGWVEPLRVAAGVGEDADFGAVVGKTGNGNESLVLYRSGRLQLLGSEELTSVTAGGRNAAPLVARFMLDGQQEFLFVVVQLPTRDSTRLEQTGRLADWAAAQTLPVIAVGTFNFEVREGGTTGNEAMTLLTTRTGWRWVRPDDAYATACGSKRFVQDQVFAGGAARDWAGRSAVNFKQSNYCNESESNRTSQHRPVIAGFSTVGGPVELAGLMPERQVGPILPATVGGGEVVEAREERAQPALVSEVGETPPAVVEAGTPVAAPASGAAGSGELSPPPAPAPTTPPPAPVASPAPVSPPAEPAPAVPAEPPAASADPEREALLERLEALEREAREIRRELEEE
jgi:hypothetical protein